MAHNSLAGCLHLQCTRTESRHPGVWIIAARDGEHSARMFYRATSNKDDASVPHMHSVVLRGSRTEKSRASRALAAQADFGNDKSGCVWQLEKAKAHPTFFVSRIPLSPHPVFPATRTRRMLSRKLSDNM